MNNNLILIGMPGSGKSTVGVVLAKLLQMDFLDADLVIQARYGKPLQAILDSEGMERFLELEADVLQTLDCTGTVIAPGGSAVLTKRGAEALHRLGTMIYLKVEPEELERRLGNLATRGVAMKPGQTILDVYRMRAPFYETWADVTVPERGSIGQTAQEICNVLQK